MKSWLSMAFFAFTNNSADTGGGGRSGLGEQKFSYLLITRVPLCSLENGLYLWKYTGAEKAQEGDIG